jgi:hypothetical protein
VDSEYAGTNVKGQVDADVDLPFWGCAARTRTPNPLVAETASELQDRVSAYVHHQGSAWVSRHVVQSADWPEPGQTWPVCRHVWSIRGSAKFLTDIVCLEL